MWAAAKRPTGEAKTPIGSTSAVAQTIAARAGDGAVRHPGGPVRIRSATQDQSISSSRRQDAEPMATAQTTSPLAQLTAPENCPPAAGKARRRRGPGERKTVEERCCSPLEHGHAEDSDPLLTRVSSPGGRPDHWAATPPTTTLAGRSEDHQARARTPPDRPRRAG